MKKLQWAADSAWLVTYLAFLFTTGTAQVVLGFASLAAGVVYAWLFVKNWPSGQPLFKFNASLKIDRKPRA